MNDRNDLPSPTASNFAQRVRETLQTYLGSQGDPLNRGLTLRDLIENGIVKIKDGFSFTGGSGVPPLGPGSSIPGNEIDLTPPPSPTGFTASPGISTVIVQCDPQTYTQGHGHLKSILYGAKWTTGGYPTFSNAIQLTDFQGTVDSYSTEPSTYWHLWLKWQSNDGVLSVTPAGGTNGIRIQTGQDVSLLLAALASKITNSQLDATLTSRINLIDGPSGTPGTIAYTYAAVNSETSARTSADNALATSISLLTAGVAGGFDTGVGYYFDATVEGWTSAGATQAWNAGWIDQTSTGTNPQLISPSGLTINGAQYSGIKARIKRLAGSGWTGTAYYTTSGHGFSTSYKKTIAVPSPFAVGDIAVIDFDMSSLTAGGADWTGNTITQIRLDLGATSSDIISIDYVAIGRNAPGASQAALSQEATVRASVDTGLLAQYSVKVDVAGLISGFGLSSTANNADYSAGTSLFGVRASTFYVAPPSVASASAPSTNLFVGYVWLDTTTSTTKYWDGSAFTTTVPAGGLPFVIQTTPTTIGGVSVPAGVYIQDAFIANGTITNAKIANATIDDAKIASLSVTKLLAGSIAVGQNITSTGFTSGSTGWKIDGNGNAEFGAATIRGQLTASQIDSRGLSIKDGSGNVILSAGSSVADQLGLGRFNNIVNSGPTPGTVGSFYAGYNTTGLTTPTVYASSDPWRPTGQGGVYISFSGTPPNNTVQDIVTTQKWGVIAGNRYEASVYISAHRSSAFVNVQWQDSTGAYLSEVNGTVINYAYSGDLAAWANGRSSWIGTAPAGACFAYLTVRAIYNGSGVNPFTFASLWYFGDAAVGQTVPSPWADGQLRWITSSNASTYIENAAIQSAQIGTLTAGNLTVTALSNTVNGSASSGARVEIAANVIRVYDASNGLRVKLGNLA